MIAFSLVISCVQLFLKIYVDTPVEFSLVVINTNTLEQRSSVPIVIPKLCFDFIVYFLIVLAVIPRGNLWPFRFLVVKLAHGMIWFTAFNMSTCIVFIIFFLSVCVFVILVVRQSYNGCAESQQRKYNCKNHAFWLFRFCRLTICHCESINCFFFDCHVYTLIMLPWWFII